MNILVIPVQSVSDLITNSSSEVFILETGKTCEEVNTILNTFTSGFRHPEVFSLKDFREWRKKLRSGEIEDDWSYPGTIFSIANGWFKDPEDEEDLLIHALINVAEKIIAHNIRKKCHMLSN